ncbi:hypothetical protein Tco_0124117 [Tanacetum coccineum]
MLEEDVEKLVDEDEESNGTEFADMVLFSDDNFSDSLKLGSYKENPSKNDNDDDDNHDDHALIRTRVTGSSEIRTEKMQTPIPSPLRSPRTDLSSDRLCISVGQSKLAAKVTEKNAL